jgi:hypothetical protein
MSIEEYIHGKVSPIKDAEGNVDISAVDAKKATKALHENIKNIETKGSGVFEIGGEDLELKQAEEENFEASLTAIEKDIEELMELGNDLNEKKIKIEKIAFSEHDYGVKIDSMDRRLKSLNSLYKMAPYPAILGRLNDALTMLDSLKANQTRMKIRQNLK